MRLPFFSLLISAAVVGALLARFDFGEILSAILEIQGGWIGAALGASFLALWVRTARWRILLKRWGGAFSLKELFPITLTGVSLGLVTPVGLGEVGRAYYAGQRLRPKEASPRPSGQRLRPKEASPRPSGQRLRPEEASPRPPGQRHGHRMAMWSSSVLDKWVGLMGVFLLGLWASWVTRQLPLLLVALAGLVGLPIFLWLLRSLPLGSLGFRLERLLRKPGFLLDFRTQLSSPASSLGICLALAVASWLLTYLQLFLLLRGLASQVTLAQVYAAGPLLTLASLMPGTWGGIGSRDVAAVLIFQKAGMEIPTIVGGCLLFNLTAVVVPALLGVAVMARTRRV